MNLKLLFFCLFYAVLLIPAELKPDKTKKQEHHDRHGHHDREPQGHGRQKLDKERKKGRFEDIISDDFFEIREGGSEEDDDDESPTDWIFELQEQEGKCIPNPCLNNGVCEQKGKRKFKCNCPKPFKGRKCQKGPTYCKKGQCGRGECVRIPTAPFYECKCKMPFQPPDCRRFAVCQPNPCRNGGQCVKDGNDFECECPLGFRGRFCQVGPNDCYVDDGESYRGNVSETEDEYECLYWNSHFILKNGADPFSIYQNKDGLGPHNFCRNPDGDKMPWCFFRKGHRLLWDYCNVTKCLEPTGVAPTEIVPTDPSPTASKAPPPTLKPTASATVPTETEKPSQAPQPSTTLVPLIPTGTAPPQQFATCGKPQPKKPLTRIFGGLKVPPGALPWQVSLQVRPKNSNQPFKHICGGVLIKSCWVLTAGHCIERNKDMQVVMGGLLLNTEEPTEQTIKVAEAIVHENYRETPTAAYNDIALLRLSGTDGVCANETQFVKTACLPDAQLPDGMECKISGWGVTEDSQYGSNYLLDANVLLINQEKCAEARVYGRVLDNSMFCAGYLEGGADSCQGDSGGPLTCQENNTSVIYGLVSWGDQCGQKNKPGVYTRVTQFLNWIKSKTEAASP
ncbi:hyaluronan-binding protein 2 [Etheostoma cragini]|uniref:hyaluronan-binding protein 2 n=1 Tax=Etheostoma cragini TaxID=417921 RepID=UPI00155E135C|nr:hyaluronan-binding protein 2 [Etheostoma cragini]